MITLYAQNPDVTLRDESDEGGLLFNPDTNQIYIVNEIGLLVWKTCHTSCDLDTLVGAIQEAYETPDSQSVVADVQDYLHHLLNAKLIGLVEN